jgi:tryptophan-rich sensory protein
MYIGKPEAFKAHAMQFVKLTACVALCMFAELIGSLYLGVSVNTWYKDLLKPWFAPPGWIFSPVRISLFFLMGISLFIIWERKTTFEKSESLLVFYIQLVANISWPIAFFYLHSPSGGLVVIAALLGLIVWTIHKFYRISRTAAYLLVPYLLWISFVAVLNCSIYYLN